MLPGSQNENIDTVVSDLGRRFLEGKIDALVVTIVHGSEVSTSVTRGSLPPGVGVITLLGAVEVSKDVIKHMLEFSGDEDS